MRTDFVVVGSGVAGLRAAIEIAEALRDVWLLTKDLPEDSNTRWAQGGIAAVLSDEDRVGFHERDTIEAGDGLSEPEAVRVLVEEGPRTVKELIDWGTEFDREGFRLAFTREGAHSARRVLHAHGDSTGREIVRALLLKTRTFSNIRFVPHAFTASLRMDGGACRGVEFIDETTGGMLSLEARAVLLATGGAGRVFRETTNPPQATGDGVALAWRAGAEVLDAEFVQFHPTALAKAGAPRFLLSEALRGEGAFLRDEAGERFLVGRHPDAELAPRDVVSREIVRHIADTKTARVYLDMTHLDSGFVKERFPRIHETCLALGVEMTAERVPVLPAAHYAMGGVFTDLEGRTSVEGLYAAGEVAATGVHGANRLASNSLLEGLVFGARAGAAMVDDLYREASPKERPAASVKPSGARHAPPESTETADSTGSGDAKAISDAVRQIAWERIGIVRDAEGLASALETLNALAPAPDAPASPTSRVALEAENLRLIATLIARGALERQESRGGHQRSDFSDRDDEGWRVHSVQRNDRQDVDRRPMGLVAKAESREGVGSRREGEV